MLEDDELDFDDFGELGEFEGQEMTTEELEKQLAMEFPDLPIETSTTTEQVVEEKPVTAETKTVEKESVMEDLDEGEIVEEERVKTTTTPAITKTETTRDLPKKSDALDKPLEAPARPQRFNNNNNNRYNQHQQQFMMPMNAFPYPQFSNRIYVNPNFQGNQQQLAQQQAQLQAQQQAQQQRYMELEQQRLALLQQQKQSQQTNDLDQKRREAAEMMRRRRENNNNSKNGQTGEKRKLESNHENDRDVKRPDIVFRQSPAGGISIKGAAAAAARENRTYTPPHQRNNIRDRIGNPSLSPAPRQAENRPSIIDRLSNNNRVQPKSDNNKPQQQQQQQQKHYVPIVTGGKSNTLLLKGFKDTVNEGDLKKMTSGSPVKDFSIDQNDKSATLIFDTIEEAVTFRRKYNRYQIGDAYISVVFKK